MFALYNEATHKVFAEFNAKEKVRGGTMTNAGVKVGTNLRVKTAD
jgi:hypothetical protein